LNKISEQTIDRVTG